MKLSPKERHALAEMSKPVGQRDHSAIHGRTIHALERKGLLGFDWRTDRRDITSAGRAELEVPGMFDDLFKEKDPAMPKTLRTAAKAAKRTDRAPCVRYSSTNRSINSKRDPNPRRLQKSTIAEQSPTNVIPHGDSPG
jgi:hypothetical protein